MKKNSSFLNRLTAAFLSVLLIFSCLPAFAVTNEKGAFRVDTFQGGAMGITFQDIVIDEDAEIVSLWTNQTVTLASLEKLNWNERGEITTELIFFAESLSSNTVLNIRIDLPDTLPVLRVQAVNEQGAPESWYIVPDGRDGSPILMEDSAYDASHFALDALDGLRFSFSSGAGGWETELFIQPDGSFTGNFHDSDMGDDGKGYPNGTVYICEFEGKLSCAGQYTPWTWTLGVESLNILNGGEAYIDDGIRYIPSAPYGLEKAESLMLILPDAPLSRLPDAFLEWTHIGNTFRNRSGALGVWGLFNEQEGFGFIAPADEDAEMY